MTNRMVGSVLTFVILLFSVVGGAAQTYTQMQWGMNKGVTPYQFGANINGTWSNLGTVSSAGVWNLPSSNLGFTQTGTGAVATTVDAKLKTMASVKDFGAIGDGGTHPLSERYASLAAAQAVYPFVTSLTQTIDWAAIQAATNTISSGRGSVYIPRGIYITKDEINCGSDSYDVLAYQGDAGGTYIRNYAATPMATFNCTGAVFKTGALSFNNLALWYPTNVSSGSIGIKLVNRQETYFNRVDIGGYYNGIVLTTSYAPRVNDSFFRDSKAAAITSTDASFKGASITNDSFFGNGIVASKAALEMSSANGAIISGNDFSTNYRHISFEYSVGVSVNGNYFENTPSYTPASFQFLSTNYSVNFTGNTIQWSTGNTFENVEGLYFYNNHLYGAQFSTNSTAKQVSYGGNYLEASAGPVITSTLSEPTYEVVFSPLISSSGVKTSDLQAINNVIARPTNSAHGYVTLSTGNASLPGFIAWYAPNNVRLGYMGYDATDIKLSLENSAKFIVSGGSATFNNGLTVGIEGTTVGSVAFKNATSGTITLQPTTGALGTVTATLPANTGTIAETNLAQTFSAAQTFSSGFGVANTVVSGTAPTIFSGFGTSPSVTASNGTAAFRINVGTGGTATSGVVGLPTAANGWNCFASDITTPATGHAIKQTATSTTSVTLTNYNNAGAATAWAASDIIIVNCMAY